MNPGPDGADAGFSLVRGGSWYQVQRRLGLIPACGLGVARRAAAFALFAWAPLIGLALVSRQVFPGEVSEPLLQSLGVHARCLAGIPLLVVAEALAERVIPAAMQHFVRSGIVDGDALGGFTAAVRRAEGVRDSTLGLLLPADLVALNAVIAAGSWAQLDEASWAVVRVGGEPHLLAAGWWYLLVARSLFALLGLLWVWRIVVLWTLFLGIARLDLDLVPTHPDRAGGLGFLAGVPAVFVPVVLGFSTVLAATLAHDVLYEGVHVSELRWVVAVYAVLIVLLCLSPLLVFWPGLTRMRGTALRDYGALVGRHGRLVYRRWVRGEPIEQDALLTAPEIGPVADTIALYAAVEAVRPLPFGMQPVLRLALAALLPMVPVATLEIPLREILLKLAGALL